ncbi:MAG: baseplate J/gp47 family protein [Actinobacteria bacterium]|nr:baseplate J/gp47 family protein [Actinomycetota bacterium]
MPIPTPDLDDRDFLQLLEEALERIRSSGSRWTAQAGPGDPGMTLLEAFAHLTEVMIYRLNRVPEKAYRSYLNLIGVKLLPPRAARATLRFSRADPAETTASLEIPRGTRVGASDGEGDQPVFVLTAATAIPAGQQHVEALAYHCELVEGEHVGVTSGQPGQVLRVSRPPMVMTADDDLIVAVEVADTEGTVRGAALEHQGRTYRIWQEVEHFADLEPDAAVYSVDRIEGTIMFAPAVDLAAPGAGGAAERVRGLARVPGPGLNVLVWYRTGGGPEGNVAPGTLTTFLDEVAGVEVTNPIRAIGGRDAESAENAALRGPHEFHARDRAVTERDYELIARRSGAVSRARAFARSEYWSYAPRGSVEVVIVPHVEPGVRSRGRVTSADLEARTTPHGLAEVTSQLEARRPLGIECVVKWAKVKAVTVRARVGIRSDEDENALTQRVLERLHRTINPLPTGQRVRASQGETWPGWPFGQALRVSDVYDILLAEPGVIWADRVRLHVDEVPDADVTAVAADPYQPSAWYAACGSDVFRSLNDGIGWEPLWRFEGETVRRIEPYPREPGRIGLGRRPGFLAVTTQPAGEEAGRVYVSTDLGETWGDGPVAQFAFPIEDLAWIQRDETPALLLATEQGLYEQALTPEATAAFSSVDPGQPDLGFYRVVSYTQPGGNLAVALAGQRTAGIYRSRLEGRAGTFIHAGLEGQDVRSLAVQYEGNATFLWAGTAAEGGGPGQGCFRTRLEDEELTWQQLGDGWEGGSCWALAFLGHHAFGASHLAGVQRLPLRGEERRWWRPAVDSGLPLREVGRFHPVRTLATDPDTSMLLAGGPAGVYRSVGAPETPPGEEFTRASRSEFDESVTLPPTWLFVSGDHDVEVVRT